MLDGALEISQPVSWQPALRAADARVYHWFSQNPRNYSLNEVGHFSSLSDFQVFDSMVVLAERGLLDVSGRIIKASWRQ